MLPFFGDVLFSTSLTSYFGGGLSDVRDTPIFFSRLFSLFGDMYAAGLSVLVERVNSWNTVSYLIDFRVNMLFG